MANIKLAQSLLNFLVTGVAFVALAADAGVLSKAAQAAAARQVAKRTVVLAPSKVVNISERPKDVVISRMRHPQAADHIEHAQRQGQPTVLHIDRAGASQRRQASIGSVSLSRKPGLHFERDEYPPAFVQEGGHNANVRYIHRRDNRGAGAVMGAQSRGLPDGSRIRIVVAD